MLYFVFGHNNCLPYYASREKSQHIHPPQTKCTIGSGPDVDFLLGLSFYTAKLPIYPLSTKH